MRYDEIGVPPGQQASFFGAMGDSGLYVSQSPRPDGNSEEVKEYLRQFFHKEACIYSHTVFQHSAVVFDALKHGPRDENAHVRKIADERAKEKSMAIPNIEFKDENEKRLTFALVFQTLKYQRFLEDMLEDCVFFSQYPEFKEDTSLVMVILCDFKQRKFQRRIPLPEEELKSYLMQIEEALFRCKTKLNAALARSRIKARVLSIDHLLPDSVRQNDKIGSNMHVYCWVNQIKSSFNDVIDQLRSEGFGQVQSENKLTGKCYMLDHQCIDMICLPYDQRDFLEEHMLVKEGHIVLQDKSSCVGPHSVRALINEGDDILHVNVGSGITTAHIASLTHNSDTEIFAFGIRSEKQQKHVMSVLERNGAKGRVKIFEDEFLEVEHTDERLKHIKVVLITAECSRSGVANPVNFIVSEGEGFVEYATKEDMAILRDLSLGYTDDRKLGDLVVKHNSTLKHALRFPRVQAVVYCTRSLLEAENENVVTRSIEYINTVQQKKTPYRIAPPVLPLSDRDIEMENPLNGKYLRYPPSNVMSGCFIATITREADDPKEAAKDILARAAARGIITGVPVQEKEKSAKKNKSGKKKEKGEKKGRKKSPQRTASPRRTRSEKKEEPRPAAPARPVVSMEYATVTRTASLPAPVPPPPRPSPTKHVTLPVHLKIRQAPAAPEQREKVAAKGEHMNGTDRTIDALSPEESNTTSLNSTHNPIGLISDIGSGIEGALIAT